MMQATRIVLVACMSLVLFAACVSLVGWFLFATGSGPLSSLESLSVLKREQGWLLAGTTGEPVVVPRKDVPQARRLAAASGHLVLRRYSCRVLAPDKLDPGLVSQPFEVRVCEFKEDTS